MNNLELCAWTSFVDVFKNFLGNHQAENHKELGKKLLKSLQDIGTDMSIKVHQDKFLDNCGDVNDEQGE